jgi:hypothetical protein
MAKKHHEFSHTTVHHHGDGSHTVHHHHESGDAKKDAEYARPDYGGMMDGMHENLSGEVPQGPGEEEAAAPGTPGGAPAAA